MLNVLRKALVFSLCVIPALTLANDGEKLDKKDKNLKDGVEVPVDESSIIGFIDPTDSREILEELRKKDRAAKAQREDRSLTTSSRSGQTMISNYYTSDARGTDMPYRGIWYPLKFNGQYNSNNYFVIRNTTPGLNNGVVTGVVWDWSITQKLYGTLVYLCAILSTSEQCINVTYAPNSGTYLFNGLPVTTNFILKYRAPGNPYNPSVPVPQGNNNHLKVYYHYWQ